MANSRSIGSVAALLLVFGGCSQGSGSKTVGPFPGVARWFSQYHPPTSNNLRAVRASGANSVIVAGEGTSIHRSDDAGQNWVQLEHVPFGRGGDIVSMDYYGANLVAVGSDSKFPASGRAWTAINGVLDFVTPDLDASVAAYRSVDVVSATTSYRLRADDVVEKDVSGTVTLLPALPPGSWNSIDFLGTTDVGYAAGDGGLIAKFDLGVWTPQTTPAAAPMYDLRKILFSTSTQGFACGSLATILRTTNGGTTWTSENYASPGVTFNSLHFPVSATNGWIVGDGGSIVFTVDGGDNWAAQICPTMEDLHDVYFA
ncbi:MAG TPA: YCF48-related protein, partial [Planctomycetota bacterium]|nr:YCF48-related protein [Planctomycetota bacterium]